MADTRGAVLITVALIGAGATVIAALIARSDGDSPPVPAELPGVSATAMSPPQPVPSVPPPAPEPASPPTSEVPGASEVPGDLGLSRSLTQPACDGSFVVFVGAAVHPPTYRTEVQGLLDAHPGSEYLLAGETCPSLRARDDAGNEIYGVYLGPFTTRDQACDARNSQGGNSYVKVLDRTTDSGVIVECR